MGQINGLTQIDTGNADVFMNRASQLIGNICDTVNGSIEFDSNILSETVVVTFTAAATDTIVRHKLGRATVRYLVAKKSAPCDVYDGTGVPTNGSLYLRGTAAATVTLVLF